MEAKHTPAPWTAAASMVSGAVKNSVFAGPRGNCILATVRDPFQEVAEANARLIAAAPDMLKALKESHRALMHYEWYAGKDANGLRKENEAVIAKATSQTGG